MSERQYDYDKAYRLIRKWSKIPGDLLREALDIPQGQGVDYILFRVEEKYHCAITGKPGPNGGYTFLTSNVPEYFLENMNDLEAIGKLRGYFQRQATWRKGGGNVSE